MTKREIEKDEINKITAHCPIREQAFFTIMRQSGLAPHIIKQLKFKNLEPNAPIPCRIDIPQELQKGKFGRLPTFMGQEAIKYLKQYLATRKNLTPESWLFTIHGNPKKEIDTKDVSRTFRQTAQKLAADKKITYKIETRKPSELTLYSLIKFYRKNAKHYLKELRNNPLKDHEQARSLYQKYAMPFLEIENQITITIYQTKKQYRKQLDNQNAKIEEMTQSIAKDNEYISSILALLYNNKGDYETGENIELGNYFIELWKKTDEEQRRNLIDGWTKKAKLLPHKDILEELTKTLESIIKPYEELKKTERTQDALTS